MMRVIKRCRPSPDIKDTYLFLSPSFLYINDNFRGALCHFDDTTLTILKPNKKLNLEE